MIFGKVTPNNTLRYLEVDVSLDQALTDICGYQERQVDLILKIGDPNTLRIEEAGFSESLTEAKESLEYPEDNGLVWFADEFHLLHNGSLLKLTQERIQSIRNLDRIHHLTDILSTRILRSRQELNDFYIKLFDLDIPIHTVWGLKDFHDEVDFPTIPESIHLESFPILVSPILNDAGDCWITFLTKNYAHRGTICQKLLQKEI